MSILNIIMKKYTKIGKKGQVSLVIL